MQTSTTDHGAFDDRVAKYIAAYRERFGITLRTADVAARLHAEDADRAPLDPTKEQTP